MHFGGFREVAVRRWRGRLPFQGGGPPRIVGGDSRAVIDAPEQIDDLLAELAALIEPVELHFRWRPQVADPGDEMVLEAAINGDADALVTYNVSDFAVAADRFGVLVLRPVDVLKKVKP